MSKRELLIEKVVNYIEKRREWDKETPLLDIIKQETIKWGRNSRTDRFNNNLVDEIRTKHYPETK
jgi:hypothetical protein